MRWWGLLLVAKCHSRIHSRGSYGRVETANSADHSGKDDGENDGTRCNFNANRAPNRGEKIEQFTHGEGEENAKDPSSDPEQ